jgi:hypothetical protein
MVKVTGLQNHKPRAGSATISCETLEKLFYFVMGCNAALALVLLWLELR